jgi:hypothetical protein
MIILFDTATSALSIDTANAEPYGGDLVGTLNRHGQVISLRGLSYGATVTVNGAETLAHVWPPANIRYVKTDQDVLSAVRASWAPDDEVTIAAWVQTPANRYETTESFVAPRPPQPYPSWTWTDGAWTPPIPYPEEGEWQWDEAAQEWVPYDDEG